MPLILSSVLLSVVMHTSRAATVLPLGGINGDGTQSAAVLYAEQGTATVKDITTGHLIRRVAFSGKVIPNRFLIVPDANGNSVPDMFVQIKGTSQTELRDSLSGELIAHARFDPGYDSVDAAYLPAWTRHYWAVALLGRNAATGRVQVETRDLVRGHLDARARVPNSCVPKQLLALRDRTVDLVPEIAVLCSGSTSTRVEIRSIYGALVSRIGLDRTFDYLQAVWVQNPVNGNTQIALLRRKPSLNLLEVVKVDAQTGALIKRIRFDDRFTPVKLAVMPDRTGSEKLALLGNDVTSGANKVQIRDATTGVKSKDIWFDKTYVAQDLAVIPDMNGNGVVEVGMLGLRTSDGRQRLIIKDADTQVRLRAIDFAPVGTGTTGTVKMVSAGVTNTCGVKTDGAVACWGYNAYGSANPPTGRFNQVSAAVSNIEYFTCGIRIDGSIACWGANTYGQSTPPAGNFSQVSTGGAHSCAIETDGSIACWGWNIYGQAAPPAGSFSQVTAGDGHTCGLKTDGSVACWGNNEYGQSTPPGGNFSQVSAGGDHTCGVKTDGSVACWGTDFGGESTPPPGKFREVAAGGAHTCGIKTDGSVACWGFDLYGQATPPAGRFSQVSAGGSYTCGLEIDASVVCWGDNLYGQATPPPGW